MPANILIVEDDESVATLVKHALAEEGHTVRWARNAFQAEGLLRRYPPDLVILDRHLPDKDGLELCREIRRDAKLSALPVLFLTAKKSLVDKVTGLRIGGDDYLVKPFDPAELVARIESLLRRSMPASTPSTAKAEAGRLRLDLEGRRVFVGSKEVELGRREFDLLQAFVDRPGRVLSRQFLLEHVWGYEHPEDASRKLVDTTLAHLRAKIGADGDKIVAVKGLGYRFDPD